jgi:hypothetical protein
MFRLLDQLEGARMTLDRDWRSWGNTIAARLKHS